jgi:hypothetical protein
MLTSEATLLRDDWRLLNRSVEQFLGAMIAAEDGLSSPHLHASGESQSPDKGPSPVHELYSLESLEEGTSEDHLVNELCKVQTLQRRLQELGTAIRRKRCAQAHQQCVLQGVSKNLEQCSSDVLDEILRSVRNFELGAASHIDRVRDGHRRATDSTQQRINSSQKEHHRAVDDINQRQEEIHNELLNVLDTLEQGKRKNMAQLEAMITKMHKIDPERDRRRMEHRALGMDIEDIQIKLNLIKDSALEFQNQASEVRHCITADVVAVIPSTPLQRGLSGRKRMKMDAVMPPLSSSSSEGGEQVVTAEELDDHTDRQDVGRRTSNSTRMHVLHMWPPSDDDL